jgi:hypothetical protein
MVIGALCACYFSQGYQEAVYFFWRVVVDQADAEEAARFFYAEMFGEVEGVVVAIPGEEAAVAELRG